MHWKLPLVQLCLVICMTGCLTQGAFAQDAVPAAKETSAEEQADQETDGDEYGEMSLEELSRHHSARLRKYIARYRAAKTKAEKSKVAETIPKVEAYQTRLIELINDDPGSEEGLEVIDWWYRRGRRTSGDVITRTILENYAKLESMNKYVPRLVWHLPEDEGEEQLRMLIKSNPFDSVKGSATYELHEMLFRRAEKLEGEEADALLAEAKELRKAIQEEYATAVDSGGATYASLLDARDFADKLEIGKTVPDIVGTDLEGVEFKLSDYDGKVRVVTYWGDW